LIDPCFQARTSRPSWRRSGCSHWPTSTATSWETDGRMF